MLRLVFTNKDNFLKSKEILGKIRKVSKILISKEKRKKRKVTKILTIGVLDVGFVLKSVKNY